MARLTGASLAVAHLDGAHLKGAWLDGARLWLAHLDGADLTGAHLSGADLEVADLTGAVLSRADLRNADLRFADLRAYSEYHTKGIGLDALKSAVDWERAYYEGDLLQKLGLPPDHNEKLAEEQKREEQHKKNQPAAGSTGAPAGQKPPLGSGKPASPKPGNK